MEQNGNIVKAYYAKQLGAENDAAFTLGITKDADGISEAEKVLYGIMNANCGEQGLIPFGEFHLLPPNVTSVRCQGAITISRLQQVKDGDFAASPFNLSYATKYGCNDKGLPEKMKRGFLREFFKGIEREGKQILAPAYDIPSTAFDTATGYLFKGSKSGKLAINENSLFAKEAYDPSLKGTPLPTWVLSLSEETLDTVANNPAVKARIRERRQALAKKLGAQFGENSFELVYTGLISILYFEAKPEDADYDGNGKLQIYSPYGVVYARPVRQARRGRDRSYGMDAIIALSAAMPAGKRVMYTPDELSVGNAKVDFSKDFTYEIQYAKAAPVAPSSSSSTPPTPPATEPVDKKEENISAPPPPPNKSTAPTPPATESVSASGKLALGRKGGIKGAPAPMPNKLNGAPAPSGSSTNAAAGATENVKPDTKFSETKADGNKALSYLSGLAGVVDPNAQLGASDIDELSEEGDLDLF